VECGVLTADGELEKVAVMENYGNLYIGGGTPKYNEDLVIKKQLGLCHNLK